VVIVGFRSDVGEDWSFPSATHSEDALFFSQWVSGEYWDEHQISRRNRPRITSQIAQRAMTMKDSGGLNRWRTVRDAIADLPKPAGETRESFPNHRLQPGARAYAGHTGSLLDAPAKTLKAGDHGVPGGENMLAHPDGSVRYFTVRESARLQTFPDWFRFPCSWTESMRQIGNAVPVRLAETVGGSVARILERHRMRTQMGNSMETHEPFNPLSKLNLGFSGAEAMLAKSVEPMAPQVAFDGAGIYAIYYLGDFPAYKLLAERNRDERFASPVYDGKAVPAGARKGGLGLDAPTGRVLFQRLTEHAESI
jgi:hypothetical protein